MNKHDFVRSVRALASSEPSREQWETMWESHQRNHVVSLEEIVDRSMNRRAADMRRIPKDIPAQSVLSLDEIANFGKTMYERLTKGDLKCSKKQQ